MRRARLNDYRDCQALAIELEKDKATSGKFEIPGFDRAATKLKEPKGKAVQEPESELVQKLLQKIESMEINHNKEIATLQNRLIQMERAQTQNFQPRNNNWQKKGQSSEQRPPNPLTNLVDNAPPYYQVCDALHEEATCPIVRRILDNGMFGTYDQINLVGSKFPLPMNDWIEVKERSRDVENLSSAFSINNLENEDDILARLYGEKPSPEQILEIARDKGLTYQRRDKDQSGNQIPPRTFNPGVNSGLDVDLGSWFNNAKIWVLVSEIAKIPSQRDKLLKAI